MRQTIRIFLCGDVMLGRGVDQILQHPCDPTLHENFVASAMDYLRLAEATNGPIPREAGPAYVWGAALEEFGRSQPDLRIVNLETSITRSEDYEPKGINYRMSPENADCLTAADLDCCILANNHVLDWGRSGLVDTLTTLERLQIAAAGAGRNAAQAEMPARLEVAGKGRVLVFAFASVTSGTPRHWDATRESAGVNLLSDFSEASVARIVEQATRTKEPGGVVVISIHWGANWGYDIPHEHRRLAHALIDRADVSIVHGHSSHHAKAIEVYRNRLILHGCGDFLNDYEGIRGYEEYRDDLALMYFADVDLVSGDLAALEIVPLQIQRFQLVRSSAPDIDWLRRILNRESRQFGVHVVPAPHGRLALSWPGRAR